MTDPVISISTMARALGARGKGVPKKIKPADRERRKKQMEAINARKREKKAAQRKDSERRRQAAREYFEVEKYPAKQVGPYLISTRPKENL